jgi:hypothetical protein
MADKSVSIEDLLLLQESEISLFIWSLLWAIRNTIENRKELNKRKNKIEAILKNKAL